MKGSESMPSIFEVDTIDLVHLEPQRAVEEFARLLRAEARTLGISISDTDIPFRIYVTDQGIDGVVLNGRADAGQGLIKEGRSYYQITTRNVTLKPTSRAEVRKFLFNRTDLLKARVRECFDNQGTLIIVMFNGEAIDPGAVARTFISELADKGHSYPNAKIEFFGLHKLCAFYAPYPSLALSLKGLDSAQFQSVSSWSRNADMEGDLGIQAPLRTGTSQDELISNLRNQLLMQSDSATHIRVWGDPGIGKTRLVLEALKTPELEPLVVYCDADEFRDSSLMNELMRTDKNHSIIAILDECDSDARAYIWNRLKYSGNQIQIVTIYGEFDETTGSINYFEVQPLEDSQVSSIIQDFGAPEDIADRLAQLCSGSPRVAHVIGFNFRADSDDLLRPLDIIDIWRRYIAYRDDPDSQVVRERRIVLQYIALFKRFGYGQSVDLEARFISELVATADSMITWMKFQQIVQGLRARKLLQGVTTLYITPKALHIKLWSEWWDIYGASCDVEAFLNEMPSQLAEWFTDMIVYAEESREASRVVRELLSTTGPFASCDFIRTKLGAEFFLALATADPSTALGSLERTIGKHSEDELRNFTSGRREVIEALERIVIWKDLFVRGARLLLFLAVSENETWANNATGVFIDLFTLGQGQVAPTEASPKDRFPVLFESISSESKAARMLAIKACDAGLRTTNFIRVSGTQFQGLRRRPNLWVASDRDEITQAIHAIWTLVVSRIERVVDSDELQAIINVLMSNARGVGRISELSDLVIGTLSDLAACENVDEYLILTTVIGILHYEGDRLPEELHRRWQILANTLAPDDFHSKMKRYVQLDLLEDRYTPNGDENDIALPHIQNLAKQVLDESSLLIGESDWLFSNEAKRGFIFGYELGKLDSAGSLLDELLHLQRNVTGDASVFTLSGYFRAIKERSVENWERTLDELTQDKDFSALIPELTWRSGMTDRAAQRVLNLAKRGTVSIEQFRMFAWGGVLPSLSKGVFGEWLRFISSSDKEIAGITCIDLAMSYFVRGDKPEELPEDLTLGILMHPSLFSLGPRSTKTQLIEYEWTSIATAFISQFPSRSPEIANTLLLHFGTEGTIVGGFRSQTHGILKLIMKDRPRETWDLLKNYLGPPIDTRAYHLNHWLRGGRFFDVQEGALDLVPPEAVWDWVEDDIETRAWYLASFVPNTLFRVPDKVCFARELLVRLGNREDVRRNLIANFSSEGWTGPASQHYEKKKLAFLEFNEYETDINVKTWIAEYVEVLDSQIANALVTEEREAW